MAPQTNRIEFQLKQQQQQQKTRHTDDVAKSDRGKQIYWKTTTFTNYKTNKQKLLHQTPRLRGVVSRKKNAFAFTLKLSSWVLFCFAIIILFFFFRSLFASTRRPVTPLNELLSVSVCAYCFAPLCPAWRGASPQAHFHTHTHTRAHVFCFFFYHTLDK